MAARSKRHTHKVSFDGSDGSTLDARLDLPAGAIRAFALFAHCFTCSKDVFAASRVSSELSRRGIAVLRFDFTGLGNSEGDFANTTFSSNVADLVKAADYLRTAFEAPQILVGHSLGGAAVLAAAGDIPEARAVATIGAPADVSHVLHQLSADLDRIESDGVAEVSIAGRSFTVRKDFVDDARAQSLAGHIASLRMALLILHAPTDSIVGIDNARAIYEAARHPKSFVSLDGADHLLTARNDATFVAEIVSAWVERYLDTVPADDMDDSDAVLVSESGEGRFQQLVRVGPHRLLADEPLDAGGDETGPTPYDFLAIGLGVCTSMTLRMYAARKKLDVGRISVRVDHGKVHADDCLECADGLEGRIDRFVRTIAAEGEIDAETRNKLLEIADKCPVHRTLETRSVITTRFED
jgi:uncharacterized OsmC-like protein/pimeloyl-ACP methyl ester carboxylesterase